MAGSLDVGKCAAGENPGGADAPDGDRSNLVAQDESGPGLTGLACGNRDLARVARRLAGGGDRADGQEPGSVKGLIADDESPPRARLLVAFDWVEVDDNDRPAEGRLGYALGHVSRSAVR